MFVGARNHKIVTKDHNSWQWIDQHEPTSPLHHDFETFAIGLHRYKEAMAALRKRIVENNRTLRDRGTLGPREHEALSDEQVRLQVHGFPVANPAGASVSHLHLPIRLTHALTSQSKSSCFEVLQIIHVDLCHCMVS